MSSIRRLIIVLERLSANRGDASRWHAAAPPLRYAASFGFSAERNEPKRPELDSKRPKKLGPLNFAKTNLRSVLESTKVRENEPETNLSEPEPASNDSKDVLWNQQGPGKVTGETCDEPNRT